MNYYDLIGFHQATTEPQEGVSGLPDLQNAAIFIDFDGTLVELAEGPDDIDVDPGIQPMLAELQRRSEGHLAIVSGRSIDAISRFLPEFDGIIVGSHGAERRGGDLPDAGPPPLDGLGCMRAVMSAYAEHHDGVLLEEKPYSAVLHYRKAPQHQSQIERLSETLVKDWDNLVVHRAKMAVEIMPVGISKRAAVEALHEKWPESVPVAIGDDRTDEGMLRFAGENGGVGVKVGAGQTAAKCRLGGPGDVHEMLRRWLTPEGRLR